MCRRFGYGCRRRRDTHLRAVPGLALDPKLAMNLSCALPHAEEPKTSARLIQFLRRIETGAVILDANRNFSRAKRNFHLNHIGSSVLHGVGHGLRSDAEQMILE